MTADIYQRLLTLPLFQGLSQNDFNEISNTTRFHFRTLRPRTIVMRQGEECTKLTFVLHGTYVVSRMSDLRDYELLEKYSRPTLLQPECLYGISPRSLRTVTCESSLQILEVNKTTLFDVLMRYETFRLNFLNYLSTMVQRADSLLWRPRKMTLPSRLADFIASRSLYPAGEKHLRIRQRVLADHFFTSVPVISQLLKQLEEAGVIQMRRGIIEVPALERLSQFVLDAPPSVEMDDK